jgi:hypothetical protein
MMVHSLFYGKKVLHCKRNWLPRHCSNKSPQTIVRFFLRDAVDTLGRYAILRMKANVKAR